MQVVEVEANLYQVKPGDEIARKFRDGVYAKWVVARTTKTLVIVETGERLRKRDGRVQGSDGWGVRRFVWHPSMDAANERLRKINDAKLLVRDLHSKVNHLNAEELDLLVELAPSILTIVAHASRRLSRA